MPKLQAAARTMAWCGLVWTGLACAPLAAAEPAWQAVAPHFAPPAEWADDLGPYRSPLVFDDGTPVGTAEDWARRRAEIRAAWMNRLGGTFELLADPQFEVLDAVKRDGYTERRVRVDVAAGGKRVEGYLLIPDGGGPFPAVLVPFYEPLTSIGQGKPDTLGAIDFGVQLTRRGFVTLSIGTPGAIEHGITDTRELLVRAGDELRRQPLGYLAHVAANCHTALRSLDVVDPRRTGIVGHSYGGKWSMFASCLDERFACAVWCDPGIVFDESNRSINYYEPWYLGWEAGTRRQPGPPTDDNPRTGLYRALYAHDNREMIELHALMAPRPVLVSGGTEDPTRNWRALNHLRAVNRLLGHEDRVAHTSRATHRPTPEALEVILRFFEWFLRPGA